jgi:Conserved oligomeric complex COG6
VPVRSCRTGRRGAACGGAAACLRVAAAWAFLSMRNALPVAGGPALTVLPKMHTGCAVGPSADTWSRRRRWVQNECRGLGEADAPEVDPVLQRATAALRARPVLLRYCAEEVPSPHHRCPLSVHQRLACAHCVLLRCAVDAADVTAPSAPCCMARMGCSLQWTSQVAGARHDALFQRFIAALTRGGPGGTPRPIEMHAHDPRRYVGCARFC